MVAANLVSRFGDSLDMIAFSWIMYEITQSAVLLALITALNFLPNIILGPFTGVLADRFSKKKLMIVCDLLRAVMVCLTAVGYLMNWLTPALLVAITLANSIVETFRQPAGSALVPKILDKDKYTIGTAFNQSFSRVMELVGMACAGGVIALIGSTGALLIDAATFVFSAVMISWIRYREELQKVPLRFQSYFKELSEGFRFLKSSPFLLCLVILGAFMNFSVSPINSFETIYLAETLHLGPEMLSAVGVALTGGMAVGAFLLPKLETKWKGKTIFLVAGFVSTGFFGALWLIPLSTSLWITICCLILSFLLMGMSIGIQNAIFSADLMSQVDGELMGRVSAIVNAVLLCMAPFGAFLCSVLAGFLSVPLIFLVFGVANLVIYVVSIRIKSIDTM